ncbi:hypothetical protein V2J09_010007 [Rumex salicifolius]
MNFIQRRMFPARTELLPLRNKILLQQACKFLDDTWNPKFVLIVAQKNHHTKFFQPGSPQNVPPGTIIDKEGTTRPTHYHILHDEIGIAPDNLQELVHNLSYVYQKSTTAISVVSPICYAHLAAAQMGQWMKFDETSETSSSHGEMTVPGVVPVPQLPTLKDRVASSMSIKTINLYLETTPSNRVNEENAPLNGDSSGAYVEDEVKQSEEKNKRRTYAGSGTDGRIISDEDVDGDLDTLRTETVARDEKVRPRIRQVEDITASPRDVCDESFLYAVIVSRSIHLQNAVIVLVESEI